MPIVIFKKSLGLNRDVPFLLADIGERDLSYKSGAVYRRGQVQYISLGSLVVLKSTTEVEGSINRGWIKEYVDLGAFSVEYSPFLLASPDALIFTAALDKLDQAESTILTILNLGDDPVSGSSNITFSIANNTAVTSAAAMLIGSKPEPFKFVASGSAQLFGRIFEPYDIFTATAPVLTSNIAGPYTIVAGMNDVIRIRYSNKNYPLEFITLTAGIRTTQEIADDINVFFPGLATATGSPNGFLQLEGLTAGARYSIEIGAAAENSTANSTLGFNAFGALAFGSDAVNQFIVTVDGVVNTIPLTTGVARTATDIANDINAVVPSLATVDHKRIILTSPTPGNTSSLVIGNGNANSTLGFVRNESSTGFLGNTKFSIRINGIDQEMEFTPSLSKSASDVVSELNGGLTDITATVDGSFVKISTTDTGSGFSLEIIPQVSGSTAFAQLGFTMGQKDEGNNAASGFVSLSASGGIINQVVRGKITVSLNTTEIENNLSADTYTGNLVISLSTGAFNAPLIVPVTLHLSETS